MEAFVVAPGGFLLAVLWFDLMFDVQVRHADVTPQSIASISAYYRRVTTDAAPMNYLVAAAMLLTVVAIVVEIVIGPTAVGWLSLPFALGPMVWARFRTVPTAVRLGAATDEPESRHALARSILRDHQACFASIATLLAVQLASAAT